MAHAQRGSEGDHSSRLIFAPSVNRVNPKRKEWGMYGRGGDFLKPVILKTGSWKEEKSQLSTLSFKYSHILMAA